jgi:hypothetical protein
MLKKSDFSGLPAAQTLLAALHVSNGDSTDLPGAGLASRVVYWRDSLHEGPVPAVGPEELREIRAAFLVGAHVDDRAEGMDMFLERDRILAANRDGEYVLWFEADLYDQLQIIQILARLADLGVPVEQITLICIGEHPDIPRFGGLGVADGRTTTRTAFHQRAHPAHHGCITAGNGCLGRILRTDASRPACHRRKPLT